MSHGPLFVRRLRQKWQVFADPPLKGFGYFILSWADYVIWSQFLNP